jgi:hypothetical protein
MPDVSSGIAVTPVRTPGDWRQFHRFRRTVYKDDPAAVMPLVGEERLLLDVDRHPFWQHAEREVFLARRDGRVVGRIAAIVDRQHQEYHSDRTGFFGFFESENDPETARALTRTAAAWLVERQCDAMRGPASPSMKGEFGVVVKGNDIPPAIMLGHTPPWYDELLRGCGFAPRFPRLQLRPRRLRRQARELAKARQAVRTAPAATSRAGSLRGDPRKRC